MKAVVIHGANDVRVDERATPTLRPRGVLVDVEWGGICGSDISYFRYGATGTSVLHAPMVLGHEVSGRIAALGSAVEAGQIEGLPALEPGAPVTVHPTSFDDSEWDAHGGVHLPPRLAGRLNLHSHSRYLGSAATDPHVDGGFAQQIVVDARQIRLLPAALSTRVAALAEPLGVAMHAVARAATVDGIGVRDRRILVNGAGPIGCLVAAAARVAGARRVIVSDVAPEALRLARALGAHETRDLTRGDPLPRDVEVVIEASGAPAALGAVLDATARGGTLVQVGNLPSEPRPAALAQLVTREISWVGSYRFIDEITDAVAAMAAGLDVSALITHEFGVDAAVEAMKTAAAPGRAGKVLLRF